MKFEKLPSENGGLETETGQEAERGFKLDFYVTDHSADSEETGSDEKLRELYADVKKDGIDSIRYDIRWERIEGKQGEFSGERLERYGKAKEIMEEVGLQEPTIVLSSIPKWAKELYKNDKEKFFEAYRGYVEQVKNVLQKTTGKKVTAFQVLNELNNEVFTPVKVEDLPRMCKITREALCDYNPDIKLLGTLLASNTGNFVGTPIEQYLPEFKKVKDSFDMIAVDSYPGAWHLPTESGKTRLQPRELLWELWNDKSKYYKDAVKDVELLEDVFREIATWSKEYELGEAGMRTNPSFILPSDEKSQRYFYDAFSRAFKHMMIRLRKEGVRLPSRVGFYEAMDEPPKNILQGVGRRIVPLMLEHDMGMRGKEGKRKMVLQGSPHLSEKERAKRPSQLRNIISYLRTPVE